MPQNRLEEIMGRFWEVLDRPYDRLRQWKEASQKKVIGCSPMDFPEELVHAAGILPVVLQETEDTITEGFSYVHPFFCGITRNIIDIAAKGELNFFDGVLYSNICIQNVNVACTLKEILPKDRVQYIQLPTALNREGVMDNTLRELKKVRTGLEGIMGHKIDDISLEQSIIVYNKHRSLLRRLHELCRANPLLLPFRDRQVIVRSSMLMSKEEHSGLLESFLAELERMEPDIVEGKRIFLSGHLCQGPKPDILDLIEGIGGLIVSDDLYTGYRYYALDVELDGNPLEGLAKRYLERSLPLPTRSGGRLNWDKYIVDQVKDNDIDGVIVLLAKYCEPHLFCYPFIKQTLTAEGIPHLMLETEHEVVSLEGMRTRLQAFFEMLRGMK